jgi:hypothetical protein
VGEDALLSADMEGFLDLGDQTSGIVGDLHREARLRRVAGLRQILNKAGITVEQLLELRRTANRGGSTRAFLLNG